MRSNDHHEDHRVVNLGVLDQVTLQLQDLLVIGVDHLQVGGDAQAGAGVDEALQTPDR